MILVTKQQYIEIFHRVNPETINYDYSNSDFQKVTDHIQITCDKGHTFSFTPKYHKQKGNTCPYCKGAKLNTETIINEMEALYPNRIDFTNSVYLNGRIKLKCIKHNFEFERKMQTHRQCFCCELCQQEERTSKSLSDYLDALFDQHGSKITCIDTSNFRTTHDRLTFACSVHKEHVWQAKAYSLTNGKSTCPFCAGQSTNTNIIIEKSKKLYGERFSYSKTEFVDSKTPIIVTCKDHGEFNILPHDHMKGGGGCRQCACKVTDTESFIKVATEVHNGKYTYRQTKYTGNRNKLVVTCLKHGDFETKPSNHINGSGCPNCGFGKMASDWLDSIGVPRNIPNGQKYREVRIDTPNWDKKKYVKVDGIDFDRKIVFEFLGDFWHGNPLLYNPNDINRVSARSFGDLYRETMERNEILNSLGYEVICIWEHDWKMSL